MSSACAANKDAAAHSGVQRSLLQRGFLHSRPFLRTNSCLLRGAGFSVNKRERDHSEEDFAFSPLSWLLRKRMLRARSCRAGSAPSRGGISEHRPSFGVGCEVQLGEEPN